MPDPNIETEWTYPKLDIRRRKGEHSKLVSKGHGSMHEQTVGRYHHFSKSV